MLDRLIPSLDKEDIIVDGGNEWYKNTQMRIERCKEEGIRWVNCEKQAENRFCGMGVSGGERGARKHPCVMFGGSKEDYTSLKPILSQDNKVITGFYGKYRIFTSEKEPRDTMLRWYTTE